MKKTFKLFLIFLFFFSFASLGFLDEKEKELKSMSSSLIKSTIQTQKCTLCHSKCHLLLQKKKRINCFSKCSKECPMPSQEHIGWLLRLTDAKFTKDLEWKKKRKLFKEQKKMGTSVKNQNLFQKNSSSSKNDLPKQDFMTIDTTSFFDAILPEMKKWLKGKENGLEPYSDELRRYHVILVPGLLCKHFGVFYFQGIRRTLKKLNISYSTAPIDTNQSIRVNTEVIRDHVIFQKTLTKKDIVLIGHSKGGVDCLDTLLRHPQTKKFIKGIITLQSPVGGAWIAEDIHSTKAGRAVTNTLFYTRFKGDPNSMKDLNFKKRKAFFERFGYYPTDEVTILSFATACTNPEDKVKIDSLNMYGNGRSEGYGHKKGCSSVLKSVIGYAEEIYGKTGDALVMKEDGIVPGSYFVTSDIYDHHVPAFDGFPNLSGDKASEVVLSLLYLWATIIVPNDNIE